MATCYRHPGRETGVSCSNCGRPICPDCMTATPVGMRCPECARDRTKVRRATSVGVGEEPVLTYVLIGINVAVALGAFLSGASATGGGGIGSSSLLADGAVSRFDVDQGDYWRLLTSGFLHTGLIHLLFNMFALYILGGMLEPAIGRLRFAIVYFVSLFAGSFGALLLTPDGATAGASGAIFGLMGAVVIVMRDRGINPMESGIGLWIGLNLLITFTIPGISIGGHLGGLAGGALAALIFVELSRRVRAPESLTSLLAGAIGVIAIAGAIAVSSGAAAGFA
ncbi:MAG TPA: rhomboid family intramembrane serine protease [Thermoleophilaceae bacterium]|nr:rhomboid family intramembrane serine protease [Thermoleophilaceae bacterium]